MEYPFLMRDLLDVCKLHNINVGIILIDQKKAFDRVDHVFLFSLTLRAFGFTNVFLFQEDCCLVKVGGELSCPIQIQRGTRQGYPISAMTLKRQSYQ